jgi:hypothetical protein
MRPINPNPQRYPPYGMYPQQSPNIQHGIHKPQALAPGMMDQQFRYN